MNIHSSLEYDGYRWRIVFNKVYRRPLNETFHEFLISIVRITFGNKWWKKHLKQKSVKHPVICWYLSWRDFKNDNSNKQYIDEDGEHFSSDAPVPVWSLVSLGYDLFCLQSKNELPDFLLHRLRHKDKFQSARYEVVCASIMIRSGLLIRYLDYKQIRERHCEFFAIDPVTRKMIGVEAKSRVREKINNNSDWKGIQKLYRRASKQKPENVPYFIFLDVNLPSTSGVSIKNKTWIQDVKRVLDIESSISQSSPDPFTALFITNFTVFHGDIDTTSYSGEYLMILPMKPEIAIFDEKLLIRIENTVGRYDKVPDTF